jgi:hypothetical protein
LLIAEEAKVAQQAAGYSGTPLWKKLGLKPGMRVAVRHAPVAYARLVADLPEGIGLAERADAGTDLAHVFVTEAAVLRGELAALRERMRPDAVLWVSWPKKAAEVATDVTEDVVRALALPLGWVDVKVCAVDAVWSGLKLVVRKAQR